MIDITWWYNFEATLDDGTQVELFNNGALHTFTPNIPHTYDKPDVHLSIGNHRYSSFSLFPLVYFLLSLLPSLQDSNKCNLGGLNFLKMD